MYPVLKVNLLIIGAGPFGLSMAAYAKHLGIDHAIVGKPMEFWRRHMPQDMYLRSTVDWHFDPLGVYTIEKFLETQDLKPADVDPLSLSFYLSYAQWFQTQSQIEVVPLFVRRLDLISGDDHRFQATTDDGQTIKANHVVIAPGFKYFSHLPAELVARLPPGRFSHTCDLIDFSDLENKRCLIIGGRQSAFEWAALLHEARAAAVHISHRHESPAFKAADWSWVNELVEGMVENPNWFRRLSQEEKDDVVRRLWVEGRLKVEPWLEARIMNDTVKLWPRTEVSDCQVEPSGEIEVKLSSGATLLVDHIILATGYKVMIDRVPFLTAGNILEKLAVQNGFPVLDDHFQTSLPGLFITSMPATQDFGPFFAFTVSVRTSAKLIGHAIAP
ncbi:MAG TPA: NAD(P)-binding domain-containing protein [Pyrinomonadaceae bacterium]|nr:NAD(P)-binding domain-containing protein [Pyrinomonadaceae bacterium]